MIDEKELKDVLDGKYNDCPDRGTCQNHYLIDDLAEEVSKIRALAGSLYLLTYSKYGHDRMVGLFSSMEKIEEFKGHFPDLCYNEPQLLVVDEFSNKIKDALFYYLVTISKDGSGVIVMNEAPTAGNKEPLYYSHLTEILYWRGWAASKYHAREIAMNGWKQINDNQLWNNRIAIEGLSKQMEEV